MEVTIEVPVPVGPRWASTFRIGEPINYSLEVAGWDSMDAMLNAFTMLRIDLETRGGFRWMEQRSLGLTPYRPPRPKR